MQKIYDVIVVGAGPAGSTSARELAKIGSNVLLIDKKKFPRNKTCGGLIPIKALKELDFHIPETYIKSRINKLTIYSHKYEQSSYESDKLLGITVLREEFDLHLVNRAIAQGVEFYDETSFKKLDRMGDVIKVFTSKGIYYSRIVVGCDGVFSKVKTYVENKKPDYKKMGFALCTTVGRNKEWSDSEFKVFQIPILYSMGWAIPWMDTVNIGIGGPWINRKNIIKGFNELQNKLNTTINIEGYRENVKGGFLPAGGFYRKVYHKGVLLAGDAAGYVDALTGEGVYYAIKNGKIVARSIDLEQVDQYEKSCNKNFQTTLRCSLVKNLLGINKLYSKTEFLRKRLCKLFSNTMYH